MFQAPPRQVNRCQRLFAGSILVLSLCLLCPVVPTHAEPVASPSRAPAQTSAATGSDLAQANQEAILREFVISPLYLPESYSDFPQSTAPPIVGALGVDVE